jgi:hypothetical protein
MEIFIMELDKERELLKILMTPNIQANGSIIRNKEMEKLHIKMEIVIKVSLKMTNIMVMEFKLLIKLNTKDYLNLDKLLKLRKKPFVMVISI